MTTKIYDWGGCGLHSYEWHEVEDACEQLTGTEPEGQDDAVQRLSQHFGRSPRIRYDEGAY